MATVYVSLGPVGSRGKNDSVGTFVGDRLRAETITSSGTTAKGALTSNGREFAKVFCATAIYANAGPLATATVSATTGVHIPAGTYEYIGLSDGQVIAVIDA